MPGQPWARKGRKNRTKRSLAAAIEPLEQRRLVVKLSSGGSHLWSSYLGGSRTDYGYGIAVDCSGGIYVTGRTSSSGWVSGGFDISYNNGTDAFVVKLNFGTAVSGGKHA